MRDKWHRTIKAGGWQMDGSKKNTQKLGNKFTNYITGGYDAIVHIWWKIRAINGGKRYPWGVPICWYGHQCKNATRSDNSKIIIRLEHLNKVVTHMGHYKQYYYLETTVTDTTGVGFIINKYNQCMANIVWQHKKYELPTDMQGIAHAASLLFNVNPDWEKLSEKKHNCFITY